MRRLLLLCLVVLPAWADDDAAALRLADQAAPAAATGSDWRIFAETAARATRLRGADAIEHGARLSLDMRLDAALAPGWRALFADRLDMYRLDGVPDSRDVNTLKEAYVSWQAEVDRVADLGRINARNGVASGYNPTDYFRAGAVRSVVSLDPAALRENRLGVAMLRGQALWDGGSFSALYAPRLADAPTRSGFNPDFGATNASDRWQLALSQKLGQGLAPQWLLTGARAGAPQLGLNLTALAGDATVAYFEWSGGRGASLAARANALPDDTAFRSRVATGLTHTTSNNFTLTLEYEYAGVAPGREAWAALRRGPPLAYARYRTLAAQEQELAAREQVFVYALWQDMLVRHLDLAAMLRHDLQDRSRLRWLELRYHLARCDLALQLQSSVGDASSVYGAAAQARSWQALVRYYF